jgi:hypothetical protein
MSWFGPDRWWSRWKKPWADPCWRFAHWGGEQAYLALAHRANAFGW